MAETRAVAAPTGSRLPAGGRGPRQASGAFLSLLTALPLLALAACGGSPPPDQTAVVVPAPPAPSPPAAKPEAAKPAAAGAALETPGFTPLPSPQQVVGPLAKGRPDPFATPASLGFGAAGAARPAPMPLPSGFRFTGVIRSGGQSQALVELAGEAGPLCLGPRGLCPGAPPLLPPGWSVAAIDVQNGLLALRQGKQKLTLSL